MVCTVFFPDVTFLSLNDCPGETKYTEVETETGNEAKCQRNRKAQMRKVIFNTVFHQALYFLDILDFDVIIMDFKCEKQ